METAVKMHLYFEGMELTQEEAHTIMTIIAKKATEAGIPMSFTIHEVEVQE